MDKQIKHTCTWLAFINDLPRKLQNNGFIVGRTSLSPTSWLLSQTHTAHYIPKTDNRRQKVVLYFLLSGYTRLTHLHLIICDFRPVCNFCLYPLTVLHILMECPISPYDNFRHNLLLWVYPPQYASIYLLHIPNKFWTSSYVLTSP